MKIVIFLLYTLFHFGHCQTTFSGNASYYAALDGSGGMPTYYVTPVSDRNYDEDVMGSIFN